MSESSKKVNGIRSAIAKRAVEGFQRPPEWMRLVDAGIIAGCSTAIKSESHVRSALDAMLHSTELLEALENYMNAVETWRLSMKDGVNVQGACADLLGCEEMARVAIAKARGAV